MSTIALAAQHGQSNGAKSIETTAGLIALFKGLGGDHHYRGGRLPLHGALNVLPQPRKTFEDIPAFAQGVARNRLLNPLTVARFTRESFEQYIRLLSVIWRITLRIEDAVSVSEKGREIFYVLLAGERRFRACNWIWDHGCENCQEQYGFEFPGTCFMRHFRGSRIEVRFCINITPLQALLLQLQENTHMRVPPHEEAYVYAQLFNLFRTIDQGFPMARFARAVGRQPETIRHALQFCDLPLSIQRMVEKGTVSYGIAVEVARIRKETAAAEEELEWWTTRAVVGNHKVPEFHEIVTKYLKAQRSGQRSLLDLMEENQRELLERPHFRKVVEASIIQAVWSWIYYFGKIYQLFEEGRLGKQESPFSERSPVRVFRRLIDQLERVLPHMQSLLPEEEYEQRQKTLTTAHLILEQLEEHLGAEATPMLPGG